MPSDAERFPVQVKPPTAEPTADDPNRYNLDIYSYDQDQHDLYTATFWTLHLRQVPGQEQVTMNRLLQSGAEALTGEYVGGDSFAEWAEVYDESNPYHCDSGTALHVYYTAAERESAIRTGRALTAIVGINTAVDATVSTAGDWAVQVEILDVEQHA